MARSIWKGEISFGLISIGVEVVPALETSDKIHFHYVDKRDGGRVRYQKINENSGQEVPWNSVGKSYESDEGSLLLEDGDLDSFKPELTKTIDLEEFIEFSDIPLLLFDKPYYLVPTKRSEKPYILLHQALLQQNKCGLGRVVIRSKQHLGVIFPLESALVLNLLFYPESIKAPSEFEFPDAADYEDKIKAKEVELANQLIESMTTVWEPDKFHDEYEEKLKGWIDTQIRTGGKSIKRIKPAARKAPNVVNIEELLQKSLSSRKKRRAN